jgi:hypothetical protein
MSLYDRVDSNAAKTQAGLARGNGAGSATETIVFVDETEAGLNENKTRGISSPGWWAYRTYTDAAGNTRHKAEQLAFITNPEANADETQSDDTIAADVASAVTITVEPANSTSATGAGTFTLTTTTTGTPGTLTYQWQRQKAGQTRWANVSASLDTGITYADFTTATLAYSGLADDSLDGYKYRVKVTSTGGTEEVISDGAATLTFGT